ncbi:MAG: uL22 family ribosomal protein [Candidatus Aenigmatarchaeota archaeon]
MLKYALELNPKKSSRAYGRSLSISTKSSVIICRVISGMNLIKGKSLLDDLLTGKRNLEGKFYTNTTKEILSLLKSAESNAEFKGLDTTRMIIYASAHQGFTFYRPRRTKMKRMQKKVTNVQIVLHQK